MDNERRAQLARGLAKNSLLPLLIEEFAEEIRDKWETTQLDQTEIREHCYLELRTLDNLSDSMYAKIREYAGDGE